MADLKALTKQCRMVENPAASMRRDSTMLINALGQLTRRIDDASTFSVGSNFGGKIGARSDAQAGREESAS